MNPHVAVPWHPSPSLTLGGSRPQSLSGRLPALFVSASEGASRCTHSRSLPRRVPRLRSGLRRDVGAVCAKPPSNKRLKLVGTNRRTGSGVLCPGGHELSFNTTAPCRRVARDFKRDPLGRLAPCLLATALQLRSRKVFLTGLFIVILAGIAAGTIAEIAKAIARRGTSSSELTALKQQVERYAASLDDAHASLADQAAQLAELQERVDFAERLLAQGRDRSALGAGSKRE